MGSASSLNSEAITAQSRGTGCLFARHSLPAAPENSRLLKKLGGEKPPGITLFHAIIAGSTRIKHSLVRLLLLTAIVPNGTEHVAPQPRGRKAHDGEKLKLSNTN
jgi:hypothetical protein